MQVLGGHGPRLLGKVYMRIMSQSRCEECIPAVVLVCVHDEIDHLSYDRSDLVQVLGEEYRHQTEEVEGPSNAIDQVCRIWVVSSDIEVQQLRHMAEEVFGVPFSFVIQAVIALYARAPLKRPQQP